MKEIALVYMVAGMSSRFGGKIKQFARIGPNNETLIEYSINQALPAGFTKIIFIVGDKTEKPFKEMFNNNYKGIPVHYAYQKFDPEKRDKPWGTTDAICSAKEIVNCPFVVCNGDDIYGETVFKQLVNHLQSNETDATTGYKLINVLPNQGTVNRGIFQVDSENNVKFIKEEFDISKENFKERNLSENSLCSMNIFGLHKQTLNYLSEILNKFKQKHSSDRKIECLLPQKLGNLIKGNKIQMKIYSTTENWIGVTNPEDEEIVKQKLKNY